MSWKKVFTGDYFGILSLLSYAWDRIRRKPHFYGDDVHKQAMDEAMRKFKADRAENAKKK